jgi:hypothetical protein
MSLLIDHSVSIFFGVLSAACFWLIGEGLWSGRMDWEILYFVSIAAVGSAVMAIRWESLIRSE